MLFEQFIESVLRLHNISQPPPNEQGRPIDEPSKDLLGDAQQQEPVASSESSMRLATGRQVEVKGNSLP
jgi:hypothetical protein